MAIHVPGSVALGPTVPTMLVAGNRDSAKLTSASLFREGLLIDYIETPWGFTDFVLGLAAVAAFPE